MYDKALDPSKNTLFTGVDKVSWLVLTFSLFDETLDWEKVEAEARRSFGESCQNFSSKFGIDENGKYLE